MKKIALATVAALAAFAAQPAFAQAAGTVDITGSVAAKCTAVTPISGTITLGELAKSTGTVDSGFGSNTGGLSRQFTIRCNGANPQLSVNAKALTNAAVTTASLGYTNQVNYTATLTAVGAKGGTATVTDLTSSQGATTGLLGDRLASASNNVTLAISNGQTSDSTAILEAGSYAGSVDVIISPAA
ncbi:hypothetical protein [Allosphingosinicella vermicomposti]|uniref:hypothetical protein n=1 Tax=Allosphingosinicella vermicomposti TaxID=614671 RepID=UPI000D1043A6|nr:hypothetical protein [Allosphingosinicella vermicomposti]